MKYTNMSYSEEHVKWVLEAFLKGSRLDFRPEQSNGEYDFDLRYSDGKIAALEATQAMNKPWIETVAAIQNKSKGGSTLKATKCMKNWIIFVAGHPDINKIRKHADGYLAELESAGIDSFSCTDCDQKVQQICGLGVVNGVAIPGDTNPTIRIAGPLGGGAVGACLAIDAGEKEAWKDDNRKKLNKATTEERHLAVYMDVGNPAVWNALTCGFFALPNCCPNLPTEITHLWLIGPHDSRHQNTFVVWYANKQEHWQSAEVVFDQQPQAAA